MAKALDRQVRKLKAKGVAVDIEALKAEYISQHRDQFNSDSEFEDPIDVVGGADDSDSESEHISTSFEDTKTILREQFDIEDTKSNLKPNPFSIDSLLYSNNKIKCEQL